MRFYIWADYNVNSGYTATVSEQTVRIPRYNWQLIHASENFYSVYTQNNTIIPDEIYGSPIEEDKAFAYNINMDKEMNRAGSLSFTIANSHPEYRNIFPLGTTIAVTTPSQTHAPDTITPTVAEGDSHRDYYIVGDPEKHTASDKTYLHNLNDDKYYVFREALNMWMEYQEIGHVIWFGRILTIEKNFNLEKTVTCEGALAFLNDIMVRPRKFFVASGQNQGKSFDMPAANMFDMCLNEYNDRAKQYALKRRIINRVISTPIESGYKNVSDLTPLSEGCTTNPVYVIEDGDYQTVKIGTKLYYTDPNAGKKLFVFGDKKVMDADKEDGVWHVYNARPGYINDTTYTEISDYTPTLDKLTEIANLDPAVGMWCECTNDVTFDLTLYLTYLPYRQNPSKILFAQNLTEYTDNGDGQDIYNAVIPFGSNKLRLNVTSSSDSTEHVQSLVENYEYWCPVSDVITLNNDYGYIEKTIDYSDINDSGALEGFAELNLGAYANRNGRSFSIGAVELSLLSENRGDGYNEFLLTDMLDADYNPNNFIEIGDGVYFSSPCHSRDYDRLEFTCTSFKMDIDNPGATSYTFEIYDTNNVPLKPKLLTSYLDKQRAIAEGKIAADGTINYSNREAKAVYKQDENHVVAYYDDHEEHFEATGTGDSRTDIVSYDMAKGTTPIPSSENNNQQSNS